MISICTQFYENDYKSVGTFIDKVINSMMCKFEIIILDNRSDKSVDVYPEQIEKYASRCVLRYIKDAESLDVLNARRKLINNANGEYVWLANIGDELTGIITDDIFYRYKPDIVSFSGFDGSCLKKIGPCESLYIDLGVKTANQRYDILSNQILRTWSFWFKKSFIKDLYDEYVNVSLNNIENVFIKSLAVSKANNIFVSPEIIYIKTQKTNNNTKLQKTYFDSVLAEVSCAKEYFKDNEVLMLSLASHDFVKSYVDKFINYFDGTDEELMETASNILSTFEYSQEQIESVVVNYGTYNQFNLTRLQYLCGLKRDEMALNESDGILKYPFRVSKTMCGIKGLLGKTLTNKNDITLCITCYDGDHTEAEDLINNIKLNYFLTGVNVLVINNCVNETMKKVDGVTYVDTHENLYSYKSRLLGAEKADTSYLWFIDGDDKLNINFDLKSLLLGEGTDITYFSNTNIDNVYFMSHEEMCYYVIMSEVDVSLHRAIFSKRLYKKFCELPKITAYLGDDVFLNTVALMNANTISIIGGYDVYKYTRSTHFLSSKYYTGLGDIINLAKEMFPYRVYKRFVDMIIFYASDGLDPDNLGDINFKEFPYLRNSDTKNFDNVCLPVVSGDVDIIYIYYGTNLEAELEKVNKAVTCNHNIIVIDLFGTYSGDRDVIRNENIYESLVEASKQIKSNHVWLLESYKIIHNFNGYHLNDETTYFYTSFTDYYNPLTRNNVIFIKDDFCLFLNKNKNLTMGDLSPSMYEFCFGRNCYVCVTDLVNADVFDESEITFFFINLDNFLDKSCIAQMCVADLKEKFPKSNIIVHNEDTLKDVIAKSKITQDIMALRSKTTEYKNFENDILRLELVKNTKKSVYIDMDILITNKENFLKSISTYPTFCQYDVGCFIKIFNEFMWSLDSSSFVNENIRFYDDKSVDEICRPDNPLYNGAVAVRLIEKFDGHACGSRIFRLLDLCSTNVRDEDIMFHFRCSRYSYYGDKESIKVGIIRLRDSARGNLEKFIDDNGLGAVYILSDWKNVDTYHVQIHECEVTSTGIYKTVGDTVSLLKQAIEKDGTIVEDFIYYSSDLKS